MTKLLEDLNITAGVPPVACVLGDNVMSFCVDAAAAVGVPCALFWTASACGFMGYRNFRSLMDEGLSPLKGTYILCAPTSSIVTSSRQTC
jgi:hypothetical protein